MLKRLSLTINAKHLLGVLLCLLLIGCASTPQTDQLLLERPKQLRPHVELTNISFFPQQAYQCGPAALATLLEHQNVAISPEQLVDKVYIPKRRGSLQLEMVATARSYGLLAYKLAPQLKDLLAELNVGNPVLIFQNLSLQLWPQWHYAVAIGYDLEQQVLILRSGTIKRHVISFATFERTWQRGRHWAYLFMKPGQVPVTATPLNYAQASHELSQAGFSEQALVAFRQGVKEWPDDSLTLMSLGNAEFSAHNLEAAKYAFEYELKLRETNHLAWNNLAYVLAARNCNQSAKEAVSCALQISPNDQNVQQSKAEILSFPENNLGSCMQIACPISRKLKPPGIDEEAKISE